MVSKRFNLKVHSLARLEGGSVSIAGDIDIDGKTTERVLVVVDREGWERIARNATWFALTRDAPDGPSQSESNVPKEK